MYGPVLRGERVTLRPPDDTDPARFVAWFADPEVTRYLGVLFPPPLEIEQEWFKSIGESKTDVFWMIEVARRAIGSCAIARIDWLHARGSTGIAIGDKTAWRKGYATEAMRLRTEYAFLQLNLHKLSTRTFMENEGARRALQKAGYREIGVAREEMWRDGRWHDQWRAEILRADWPRRDSADPLRTDGC